MNHEKSVDFIGVGTGPFNLSIAALSHQIEELDCLFFDEHPHFSPHPGMLVPDCHMQTVFLKDLVSAVAPTNPYSFVNYLVKHKSSIASLQADYVQYPVKSFLTTSAGLLKI